MSVKFVTPAQFFPLEVNTGYYNEENPSWRLLVIKKKTVRAENFFKMQRNPVFLFF